MSKALTTLVMDQRTCTMSECLAAVDFVQWLLLCATNLHNLVS